MPFPPGLGTNAGSDETWILSSCHQALADHVGVSARSLSFQSFALVFLNYLRRTALGGCKWFYLHMPFSLLCLYCYGDSQLGAGKEESAFRDVWRVQRMH